MHALIIEDQPLIAMMIEEELAEQGYTTFDFATRQADAVQLAVKRCPDLITADDQLIEGTGIGAVREICAHQAIPVVYIAGALDELSIPDAVILPKPFRSHDLREAVRRAIATPRTYA
jgi:DNA-binding response OmpR family regulator